MAYVEIWSPNRNKGNGGFKKSIIVVHTSEPGQYAKGKNPGTAEGLGNYLKNPNIQASYHIAVDKNGDKCRMVSDTDRAWHAGGIGNNEGYSICAVGWSAWSRDEWLSMPNMLDSMAEEIAAWCKKEGIPARFVSSNELPKDVWGITGHWDTALAWRQTDHTDPGKNFPYDILLEKVNAILRPVPKETPIQTKRRLTPWLGDPITQQEDLTAPDGVGKFREYSNGMIYFTPKTGACALSPEMVDKYRSLGFETGSLGYPTSDVFDIKDGGRCQRFQGANMYYHPKLQKVFLVYGRIGAEYASWEWENGFLGYPIEDPVNCPGYSSQKFDGGEILWSSKTDAHAVYGEILKEFNNGRVERWGLPLKAEGATQDNKGRYQNYEFGTIYFKWGTDKAFGVKDKILKAYKLLGYEVGNIGFPASDEKEIVPGLVRQSFDHGYIQVNLSDGDTEIMIDGEVMN